MGLPSRPPLFSSSFVGRLRLIVYISLALFLMVLDHQYGWLWRGRYGASMVVEPLYRLASLPVVGMSALADMFTGRKALIMQNRHLREQLLLVHAELDYMQVLARQNRQLKLLLGVSHQLRLKVKLARVIDVDLGMYRHLLTLNAGTHDGVKVGQPVMDAYGVMGQVIKVLPSISVMLMITDSDSALPVVVRRTGLRVVAYGSCDGDRLVLPNLPRTSRVRVGDQLLTSGIGGRFPPGLPVGEVLSLSPSVTGMFLEARVVPSAALDRSQEVLLLSDGAVPMHSPVPGHLR